MPSARYVSAEAARQDGAMASVARLRPRTTRLAVAALLAASTFAGPLAAGAGTPVGAADDVAGAAFVPVTPCRLLDTRDSVDRPGPALAAGRTVTIDVAGRCNVGEAAVAAALTLTVVDPDEAGYATLYPDGAPPATSTVNYRAGSPSAITDNTWSVKIAGITVDSGAAANATRRTSKEETVDLADYLPLPQLVQER